MDSLFTYTEDELNRMKMTEYTKYDVCAQCVPYLTFTSEGTSTVYLENNGGNTPDCTYSLDQGNTWETMPTDSGSSLSFTGTMYVRGYNIYGFSHSYSFDDNDGQYSRFVTGGDNIDLGGTVMALMDNGSGADSLSDEGVYGVRVDTIPYRKDSVQPFCFVGLFASNSNIVSAPLLPATELYLYCYLYMFYNCPSLKNAPALPATILSEGCYDDMFGYCTALAKDCYYNMFRECTSLETAPVLPAETLVEECYGAMFYKCSSLNYIKAMCTDLSANKSTYAWINGVASTGTFVKNEGADWSIKTNSDGIPAGWTVETAEA